MMDKFIRCLCHADYSCLVIEGEFTDEEKYQAWQSIFIEFLDAENSQNTQEVVHLQSKINDNSKKLTIIELCLTLLSYYHTGLVKDSDKEIAVNQLKKYGFNYQYSNESMSEDLQRVQSISKTTVINLKSDRSQLERLTEKHQNTVKESDFAKIFIILNKNFAGGFKYTPQNTTVSEYAAMLEMLK